MIVFPLVENTMKDIRSIGLRDDERQTRNGYNLKKCIKSSETYFENHTQLDNVNKNPLSPIVWLSACVCFSSRDALVPGELLSQMFDKRVDFKPVVFDASWPEEKEVKESVNGMFRLLMHQINTTENSSN